VSGSAAANAEVAVELESGVAEEADRESEEDMLEKVEPARDREVAYHMDAIPPNF
jgi:hypothetical protein